MFDQARQPCGHAWDSIDSISIFQDDNQRIEHANAGGLANLPTSSIATVDLNASPLGNMNFGGVRQCSVSSHTVLRGGGVVLGNVDDEKKHGYVSEHSAERYDFFISHNWSVERWKKFLALCLIWSGKHALISSCFLQLLTFSLVVMGILPVSTSHIDEHEISCWCITSTLLTYFFVFLLSHDLLEIFGVPGYRTFLDKVCVDQSDERKKKRGIEAITAFLYHSDAMVVLYSEVYLKRLWTVYELTTFLALKPDAKLIVQPVIVGPVAIFLVLIQLIRIPELFLVPLNWNSFDSVDSASLFLAGFIILMDLFGLLVAVFYLRLWGNTRAKMGQQVEAFAFERALCHNEVDRFHITCAIKKIARQEGLVPSHASTSECLQRFEEVVRTTLPRRMNGAFMWTGISCQAACLMTTPAMALVLDYSAVRLRQKMASEDSNFATELLAEVLQDMMVEVLMPIAIGLIGIVSGRKTGGVICEGKHVIFCVSS